MKANLRLLLALALGTLLGGLAVRHFLTPEPPLTYPPLSGQYLPMEGVSVRRTTNYVTKNTNAVIPFDRAEYDSTGGRLWTIERPTRIGPIPREWDGLRVVINAEGIWLGGISGLYRELKVFRNGRIPVPVAVTQHAPAHMNTGLQLTSRPIVVRAGDYFELCGKTYTDQVLLSADDYSITFGLTLQAYRLPTSPPLPVVPTVAATVAGKHASP